MTASLSGTRLIAAAMMLMLLTGLAWWWLHPTHPQGGDTAAGFVQLPFAAPPPTDAAPRVIAPAATADIAALPDPRIASTLQDPGATFRNVRSADAAHQVVCGELRPSDRPYYRRFVWVAQVQMLATDDDSPEFTRIAALCDGPAALSPSGL